MKKIGILYLCAVGLISAIVAMAQSAGPSLTMTWNAVTTMADGTPVPAGVVVTYNLYGGHTPTGPWSSPISIQGTSTQRNGVAVGQDCYYLTAVISGKESPMTAVQCTVVSNTPSTVPATPTGFTIQTPSPTT